MDLLKVIGYMEAGGMLSLALTIIVIKLGRFNPNDVDFLVAVALGILGIVVAVRI